MRIDPRALLVGSDTPVPVARGGVVLYAHCDHAASTPPLARVLTGVMEAAASYANVHRGTGWKSRRTSERYEDARERVARALGAGADQVVVFTRNTTQGLNLVSRRLAARRGEVAIVTGMEHHSNDLPWRRALPVLRAPVDDTGRVDEERLRCLLRGHAGRVAALAVTAASNVTGVVNPVHRWARWAHEAGALIVVDAAQLVPHRPLDCRPAEDPEHLDVVAFSAHKCYAPFGAGALVAPRSLLAGGDPAEAGGGTVEVVGDDYVAWAAPPAREEAGTPPVLGAIALADALDVLEALGRDAVVAHEDALAARAHARLRAVPGLTLYGDAPGPFDPASRLGVFSFGLAGLPHGLVGAALDHEWGIGTRTGCFCAHPYVKRLLGLSPAAVRDFEARTLAGDRSRQPGMVRASLGLATTAADVERLGDALEAVARGDHEAYEEDRALGDWRPAGLAAARSRA